MLNLAIRKSLYNDKDQEKNEPGRQRGCKEIFDVWTGHRIITDGPVVLCL